MNRGKGLRGVLCLASLAVLALGCESPFDTGLDGQPDENGPYTFSCSAAGLDGDVVCSNYLITEEGRYAKYKNQCANLVSGGCTPLSDQFACEHGGDTNSDKQCTYSRATETATNACDSTGGTRYCTF